MARGQRLPGSWNNDSPVADMLLIGDRLRLTLETSLDSFYVSIVLKFIEKVRYSMGPCYQSDDKSGRTVTMTMQAAPGEAVYDAYTGARGLQTTAAR